MTQHDVFYTCLPHKDGSGDITLSLPDWSERLTRYEASYVRLALSGGDIFFSGLAFEINKIHGTAVSLPAKGMHGIHIIGDGPVYATIDAGDRRIEFSEEDTRGLFETLIAAIDAAEPKVEPA